MITPTNMKFTRIRCSAQMKMKRCTERKEG